VKVDVDVAPERTQAAPSDRCFDGPTGELVVDYGEDSGWVTTVRSAAPASLKDEPTAD